MTRSSTDITSVVELISEEFLRLDLLSRFGTVLRTGCLWRSIIYNKISWFKSPIKQYVTIDYLIGCPSLIFSFFSYRREDSPEIPSDTNKYTHWVIHLKSEFLYISTFPPILHGKKKWNCRYKGRFITPR